MVMDIINIFDSKFGNPAYSRKILLGLVLAIENKSLADALQGHKR
jgi:hypothetical protein